MSNKPNLFDPQERQPDTSRPGGKSWIFQGPEHLTIQYSEIFSNPESMTHIHEDYEQIMIVVDGTANFWCGDEYYELTPGCMMAVPAKVPHGIQARTDTTKDLKLIELFVPADRARPESPKVRSLGHLNWD